MLHAIIHGRLAEHPFVQRLRDQRLAEIHLTTHRAHAQVIAAALPVQAHTVVVVGGDGTLHDVVNGLMKCPAEQRPRIVLVPLGTGNDVARALKVDASWESMCSRIDGQRFVDWDVLRIDYTTLQGAAAHRHCINVADIGLGGEVTRHYDGLLRRYPFGIGYMVAGLKGLSTATRSRARISIDECAEESTILSVCLCNSSWFGSGIGISPMADPQDGLVDVTVVGDIGVGTYVGYLPRLRAGKPITHPQLRYHRGRKIRIDTQLPLPVEIDGEYVGTGPVVVSVIPKAIMLTL